MSAAKLLWHQKVRNRISSKSSRQTSPSPSPSQVSTAPASSLTASPTPLPPHGSSSSSLAVPTQSVSLPASSRPNTAPPASSQSSPSSALTTAPFLSDALQRLEPEQHRILEESISSTSVDIKSAFQDVVDAANNKRQYCLEKRWIFNLNGRKLVLREKADLVIHWLNRFKGVGDVVANADPIHIGLPWAGVRLVLETLVADSNEMAALLTGCEMVLYMASRLDVYVRFWRSLSADTAKDNLEESITVMYAHVLKFLAQAIQIYQRSTVRRIISAVWKLEDVLDFEKTANELAVKVEFDASNCARAVSMQGQSLTLDVQKEMRKVLTELQQYHQLQTSVDQLRLKIDFSRIPYAKGAIFNASDGSHDLCHPATRMDVLDQGRLWAQDPDGKSIFWLEGAAGAGKSTIAKTFAQWLTDHGSTGGVDLGASYFFKRGEGDRGSANRFFPTIVRQLMMKIPGLDVLIAATIELDPFIFDKALAEQFRQLVLQPLRNTSISRTSQLVLVVVVDALDECDEEVDMTTILRLWTQLTQVTSVSLRLFLTSRPELPIHLQFRQFSTDLFQNVDLVAAVSTTTICHDLFLYLRDTFDALRQKHNDYLEGTLILSEDWPADETIRQLVDMAQPLFVVAATMCRLVMDLEINPQEKLKEILDDQNTGGMLQIQSTYTSVLRYLDSKARDHQANSKLCASFRLVIGAVILLAEPMSVKDLSSLLDVPSSTILRRISPLRSVIRVPADHDTPVRTFHLSFGEFLLSEYARGKAFALDCETTHSNLSACCLRILCNSNGLRKNICDLDHSGQLRRGIDPGIILDRLSSPLRYACRYWPHHVQHSGQELQDDGEVHVFLKKHFLHWLEALSLLNLIYEAFKLLGTIRACMSESASTLSAFLQDARRFLLANKYTIDLAPLQVYSSAIIFVPERSLVRSTCAQVPRWIRQYPSTNQMWGSEQQKLIGDTSNASATAFSSDGSLIASGGGGFMIRLWDSRTGREIQKLRTRKPSLSSLALSPDGSVLASGFRDYDRKHVVSVWDIKTAQEVLTLRGDFGEVTIVTFSPSGSQIASATTDGYVTIWHSRTGRKMWSLQGHPSSISSVAFSSDGLHLASASFAGIVCLWDIETGCMTRMMEDRESASEVVPQWRRNLVAFTANGSVLKSLSSKRKICSWDVRTGQKIRECESSLSGHNPQAAFSPDGSLLATMNKDSNIKIIDSKTGDVMHELESRLDIMAPLIFTADGSVLASTSSSGPLCLWELQTESAMETQQAHAADVTALTLAPDGLMLATASRDDTIKVWDTQTGQELCKLDNMGALTGMMTFSADSSKLAYEATRYIRLWNVGTSQRPITLTGHKHLVTEMAFSHDGSILASTAYDSTVRLWNAQTGHELQSFDVDRAPNILAFSPDDSLIFSCADSGTRVWTIHGRGSLPPLIGRIVTYEPTKKESVPIGSGTKVDSKVGEYKVLLHLSEDGWIRQREQNLLWIPHEYRGKSVSRGNKICIGAVSGLVSIFEFDLS